MNHPTFLRSRSFLTALAAACLLPAIAHATEVVNYDGVNNDYGVGSGTQTIALPTPTTTGNYTVYAYDPTTPLSAPGYTGPTFYGAAWLYSSDPTNFSTFSRARLTSGGGALSEIQLGILSHKSGNNGNSGKLTSDVSTYGASFIAFQKSGFTGISMSDTLSFDVDSSLLLTIQGSSNAVVYLAVEAGNQWYISSTSSTSTGLFGLSGQGLLDSTWGAWDPNGGSNGQLEDAPTSFGTLGSDLTDIEAVGYLSVLPTSTTANEYTYISQFSTNLNAVETPEPSTTALLGGAILLLGLAARRRLVPAASR
jgi:hypothetical protein